MKSSAKKGALAAVFGLVLAACAAPEPSYNGAYTSSTYGPYGTVESVDVIRAPASGTTGVGAVVGGIAGGVLGHQIGSGSGRDAATVAGVVGGALAGNEIERHRNGQYGRYRIAVRMDDGSYRTFEQDSADVRPGDRVRIDNGRATRY